MPALDEKLASLLSLRDACAMAALLLLAAGAAGCGSHGGGASVAAGRRVFVAAGCGGCHTVAAARTHGTEGPDFDTSEQLDRGQILAELNIGVGGMPSYRHRLSARQERDVTEFVFQVLHARGRDGR